MTSREAPRVTSHLSVAPLTSESLRGALQTYSSLVESCYGPDGGLVALHNNRGGHVTFTRCCARMLPLLTVEDPVMRLVTSCLGRHCSAGPDAGLFCVLLCLNVLKQQLCLSVPQRLTSELTDVILTELSQILSEDARAVLHVPLDVLSTAQMRLYITSILYPKLHLTLSESELNLCGNLALEVFYTSFKATDESAGLMPVDYVTVDNEAPSESHCLPGVLLECPQVGASTDLHCRTVTSSAGDVIRTALFTVSLCGDEADMDRDVTYKLSGGDVIDDVTMQRLSQLVTHLCEIDVGLLLSQKVIHPRMKKMLRRQKVLFVERLGTQKARDVLQVTGGQALGSLNPPTMSDCGSIQGITRVTKFGKSYYHLTSQACQSVTVFVCHRDEESARDLKTLLETAQHELKTVLTTPRARGLVGAGCWQTAAALLLYRQMTKQSFALATRLGCSGLNILDVTRTICNSLLRAARLLSRDSDHVVDLVTGHHWMLSCGTLDDADWSDGDLPCGCGAFTSRGREYRELIELMHGDVTDRQCDVTGSQCDVTDTVEPGLVRVIDSCSSAVGALRTALSAASLVMSVGTVVRDTN